jgi:hypothetical protein
MFYMEGEEPTTPETPVETPAEGGSASEGE